MVGVNSLSVSDRYALQALVLTWSDCLHRDAYDQFIELFTEDGRYAFEGQWDVVGRDALVERYRGRKPGDRISRHVCSNLLLRADGEHEATGVGLLTVYRHVGEGMGTTLPDSVQDFRDRYRRMPDGTWRFVERVITPVFVREGAGVSPR